jgi:hypothetical protein
MLDVDVGVQVERRRIHPQRPAEATPGYIEDLTEPSSYGPISAASDVGRLHGRQLLALVAGQEDLGPRALIGIL